MSYFFFYPQTLLMSYFYYTLLCAYSSLCSHLLLIPCSAVAPFSLLLQILSSYPLSNLLKSSLGYEAFSDYSSVYWIPTCLNCTFFLAIKIPLRTKKYRERGEKYP